MKRFTISKIEAIMKKELILILMCITTLSACAKNKGGKRMEYVEKSQINNEIAGDCPVEVSEQRAKLDYGKTEHVNYHSETCGLTRGFTIYLPSSYDGNKKFPVMYFQHGIFGDENCIIFDQNNKIKEIATNLAADGLCKECIIVFGNMYATKDPKQKPAFSNDAVLPYDNFINELVNDLMPYVEKNYQVLTGPENTAICGFSMGGRESLFIGLQRPDLFGYIGAIAPAPGLVPSKDWAMSHPGQLQEEELKFKEGSRKPELLMVCCGTNDGTVGQFPKTYHRLLTSNGVEHLWFEVIGADHNSHAIRAGLYQFLIRSFK